MPGSKLTGQKSDDAGRRRRKDKNQQQKKAHGNLLHWKLPSNEKYQPNIDEMPDITGIQPECMDVKGILQPNTLG